MLINYLSMMTLSSFFLGLFFIFIFKKVSLKYRLLISSQKIPLIGGMAMALAFIFTYIFYFSIYGSFSKEIMGIIISSFIMLIFGVIDDWRELSIMLKFLVQIIATTLLILFGIRTQIVYIGDTLNIIITFIWILGITNALNHLDVLDGLASGTTIIVSLAFFAISILNGEIRTAILSLTLVGAAFSFLLYNWPPAKIYMGNSGSHFLGFILGAIALLISYAPLERKVALLSPLVILGFPIFDTVFLILTRIGKKKLPFKKSNDHLALRFLAAGYSKKKALLAMLGLGLFFSLCGVVVSQASNSLGLIIITVVVLVSLFLGKKISSVVVDG